MSSRSSESERRSFRGRFPYWRDSFANILNEADGEEVVFVSYGTRSPSDAKLSSIEERRVAKWVVGNSYDEWSEEFSRFADSRSSPVEWLLPDWPEANAESEGDSLLFIGDLGTDSVWMEAFVMEAIGELRGISVRSLDFRTAPSWSDVLDVVSKATVCVSLLGDRQIEHWLYKAALQSGCESWVSVGNNLLDVRYLGDSNRNRISVGNLLSSKLRRYIETIAGLSWEGCLEREMYDESRRVRGDFDRWLRTDSLRAMEFADTHLPREENSGAEFEGDSLARASASILAALGGHASVEILAPILNLKADARRGFFDELMPRRYCDEWAEVFLYRSFRDKEWLSYSLNEARNGSGVSSDWRKRNLAKIGRTLLEQVRLSVYGYDERLPKQALELLLEGVENKSELSWDLMGGLGLASVLAKDESRLDEFANAYLSRFPGAEDFFLPIAEHCILEGSYENALLYIDRELEANGMRDRAQSLKIDVLCRLGKLENALELVDQLAGKTAGLVLIATAPFRFGQLWSLKDNTISDDKLRTYLKIAEGIEDKDSLLNRAIGVYASRLGDWDRAENVFRRLLSDNRNSGSVIGRLKLDLARLEVESTHFNISELSIEGVNWVKSLADGLVFATTLALEGKSDGVSGLKSLIGSDKGLASPGGFCTVDEANAVRYHALVVMKLLGLYNQSEQESLAGRLMPKVGRLLDPMPNALSSERMETIVDIRGDANELCSRAKLFLEPRFLDV